MSLPPKIIGAAALIFCAGLLTGKFLFQENASTTVSADTKSSARTAPPSRNTTAPAERYSQKWLEEKTANIDEAESLTDHEYRQLTETDPEAALAQALALPPGLLRERAVLSVIDQWASTDSMAAFQWIANGQDDMPALSKAYALVMGHHIRQDPHSAATLISAMAAGDLKNSLASQLAQTMAENNPSSALQWSKTLEDPKAYLQATSTALQEMAKNDQRTAMNLALAEKDPALRNQLLDHVGLVMARTNPDETVKNLDQFPKTVQPKIIEHIAGSWVDSDPAAAAAWIETLPKGPLRDGAIQRSLARFASIDPNQAFQLASSVNDSAERYGLMRDALMQWHQIDPSQSAEALANSPHLTADQQAFLADDIAKNAPVPDLVIPRKE